jgi:hypothetical protein
VRDGTKSVPLVGIFADANVVSRAFRTFTVPSTRCGLWPFPATLSLAPLYASSGSSSIPSADRVASGMTRQGTTSCSDPERPTLSGIPEALAGGAKGNPEGRAPAARPGCVP